MFARSGLVGLLKLWSPQIHWDSPLVKFPSFVTEWLTDDPSSGDAYASKNDKKNAKVKQEADKKPKNPRVNKIIAKQSKNADNNWRG